MSNVRIILAIFLMALTACGGGGGGTGSGGGGGVSLTVSINPDDGIALTQSATLSWSSDGTSATLITKEVATVQALNREVKQDSKPRVIFEKEPDGRMKMTHILYEDDVKEKVVQKAAVEEKTIATAALPPSGSMQVSPTKTTTYTIRATGTNGSAEKSVTLTVIPHTPDELVLHYNLQPEYWTYGRKAKTMRWENGTVEVYDSTGFATLQEALDGWNQAIGGPVTFRKSANPNSPIKIREDAAYIDQLGANICAVAPHWIANASANDYRIIGSNIYLYPNKCVAERFIIMQHEIGHAIGFNRHTNMGGANIMDTPPNYGAKILPLARIMIHRLYELPVGTELY